MCELHAKFHQNWWSGFREIAFHDTEGHSFIIIRILMIFDTIYHLIINRIVRRSGKNWVGHVSSKVFVGLVDIYKMTLRR